MWTIMAVWLIVWNAVTHLNHAYMIIFLIVQGQPTCAGPNPFPLNFSSYIIKRTTESNNPVASNWSWRYSGWRISFYGPLTWYESKQLGEPSSIQNLWSPLEWRMCRFENSGLVQASPSTLYTNSLIKGDYFGRSTKLFGRHMCWRKWRFSCGLLLKIDFIPASSYQRKAGDKALDVVSAELMLNRLHTFPSSVHMRGACGSLSKCILILEVGRQILMICGPPGEEGKL